MGDEGAIKAGDAYVEMSLDKSKLDKELSKSESDINRAHDSALKMNAARSMSIDKAEAAAYQANARYRASVDRAEFQAYSVEAQRKAAITESIDRDHSRALEMNASRSLSIDKAEVQARSIEANNIAAIDRAESAAYKEDERRSEAGNKRIKQLGSQLLRMTGYLAVIHISAAAIEGAFSQMASERSMEKALAKGDIVAATAEMRKAETSQEAWLRNLPLIGGYIGKMFDAFKDRSLEEFAKQVTEADDKGQALAKTLDVLREAELALAKARGETPEQLKARGDQADKEKAEVSLGQARADWAARRAEQEAIKVKRDELAQSKLGGIGVTTEEARSRGKGWHVGAALLNPLAGAALHRKEQQLSVYDEDLRKAIVNTNRARGVVKGLEKAASMHQEASGLPSAKITGMQEGSALGGAGASGVAWGVGAETEASPAEQLLAVQQGQSGTLEAIKGTMDGVAKDMATVAVNTAKPPPSPYTVGN